MKVSCRVRGDWFHVPCREGDTTIRWLGEEALKRYLKLKPPSYVPNKKEVVNDIRKTAGGAILDPADKISDVLDDNDFISIVLESDRPNPRLTQAEIKFVPEQIPGGKFELPDEYLFLDGNSLSTDDLLQLGKGRYKIKLTKEAEILVTKARLMVDEIVRENRVVYGITTGFGKFARTVIEPHKLRELQENLIRSHSAGVGKALTPENTRMLLALRINVLAKGYSGIRLGTLQQLIDAFNESCLSWVPEQGSVGASGDLAPLAHLALGLMGEGRMWSPQTGWGEAKYVLESHNLSPITLEAKEGLALINGTQLITSIGAEAVERAGIIARQADVVAALTLEVLKGTSRAFDSDVQKIRPHKGQALVARRLRSLLHSETYPSEIAQSHRFCNRVQDAYTLRCCPQVHGIVHDTIEFVRGIITTEMNSGTDNPIVFSERKEIISAGNFHGEYPAKALDYLAIGIHELAAMSERRIERLVNPAYSELPAFLVKDGGLNSGFMIPHVIAIELLAACQAIEFLRPLKTTVPLEEVYNVVRSVVSPLEKDRYFSPDIRTVTDMLKQEKIWNAARYHMENYHASQAVETRVFSPTTYTFGEDRPQVSESVPSNRGKRDASESKTGAVGKRRRRGSSSSTNGAAKN
eukprot:maker-scaffold478_size161223-snap-gene-0.29 protein:Tk02256 transcript:maker-scaffold478_size161223-snap-gene-0.29-mRNA-1 annotation:"histidine ammonia-lyase"